MTRNLKLASSNIHCLTFYFSDDRKKAFCLKLNHFQEKSVINIAKVKSNIAFKGCLKKGSFTEMSVFRSDFLPTKGNLLVLVISY